LLRTIEAVDFVEEVDRAPAVARQPVALRLPATVRWGRPEERGGFVFGVSFEGADPDAQTALDALVEAFLRRAASIV